MDQQTDGHDWTLRLDSFELMATIDLSSHLQIQRICKSSTRTPTVECPNRQGLCVQSFYFASIELFSPETGVFQCVAMQTDLSV